MGALAGDLPNYEEALRALYASDLTRFKAQVAGWPKDLRRYFTGRMQEADEKGAGTLPNLGDQHT
jgi:hypothetical protein